MLASALKLGLPPTIFIADGKEKIRKVGEKRVQPPFYALHRLKARFGNHV